MLQKLTKKRNEKGFTLIELMIVIAIIGILAAIAIPNFIQYRRRAYNSAANADAKNCYTAAQAYFTDNASGTVALADIVAYGFRQSSDVTVTIAAGTQSSFSATSSHSSGDKTFTIDSAGNITS